MLAEHTVKIGGKFYFAGQELPSKVAPAPVVEEKPQEIKEPIAKGRGRKKAEE